MLVPWVPVQEGVEVNKEQLVQMSVTKSTFLMSDDPGACS